MACSSVESVAGVGFRRFPLLQTRIPYDWSLILAATVYHLWQERNRRVFNNNARSASSIINDIYQQIRDKLSSHGGHDKIPETTLAMWNIQDE
ncbi:hypothetical protein OIU84_030283 [Salix udensis]|uniref:Uncharacterized protein n=1 Tax=Salix udensis TaxID=889485 RepID=A0AAD6KDJ2_9ROSI|nr:hypothetical protein OIU84_030283 [Salix udensis]